jgi:hypothetical protein
MLVSAGEKIGCNPLLTFVTRDRVGNNHHVEMAQMRKTVRVEDGSGYVENVHETLIETTSQAEIFHISFSISHLSLLW